MSFLLGGEYDSSGSSSGSESEADERQERRRDASEDGDGGGDDGGERRPAAALPSADSVLDSVSTATASFRAPRPSVNAASTSLKTFDLLEEEKQQREKRKEERDAARRDQEQQRKQQRDSIQEAPTRSNGTRAGEKDKRDAKERVKQQRVKGQAGIGSDFRAWKSETEMALRQQFD